MLKRGVNGAIIFFLAMGVIQCGLRFDKFISIKTGILPFSKNCQFFKVDFNLTLLELIKPDVNLYCTE